MSTTNEKHELKQRVEAKRKRLEAQVHDLKADASEESRKKSERLQAKLNELKTSVADGYDNLQSATLDKINNLLKD